MLKWIKTVQDQRDIAKFLSDFDDITTSQRIGGGYQRINWDEGVLKQRKPKLGEDLKDLPVNPKE